VFLVNVVIQWVAVVNQRILVVSLWVVLVSISCSPRFPAIIANPSLSKTQTRGLLNQATRMVTTDESAARQARHRDRRKRGIAAVIRVEVFGTKSTR